MVLSRLGLLDLVTSDLYAPAPPSGASQQCSFGSGCHRAQTQLGSHSGAMSQSSQRSGPAPPPERRRNPLTAVDPEPAPGDMAFAAQLDALRVCPVRGPGSEEGLAATRNPVVAPPAAAGGRTLLNAGEDALADIVATADAAWQQLPSWDVDPEPPVSGGAGSDAADDSDVPSVSKRGRFM